MEKEEDWANIRDDRGGEAGRGEGKSEQDSGF